MSILRASLAAALVAVFASSAAHADTLYQTAAFVDYSAAGEPGDYYIDDSRYLGAVFSLAKASDVTGIGGYFTQYSGGNLFGAIVSVDAYASTGDFASSVVGHTMITPDGLDDTAALNLHLAAGNYAVVFGSGLYGTSGTSGLVSGQDGSGATIISGTPASFGLLGSDDVHIAVYGNVSAVPEPANVAMLVAGMLALGGVAVRNRRDSKR
jgi:hypothetical protein